MKAIDIDRDGLRDVLDMIVQTPWIAWNDFSNRYYADRSYSDTLLIQALVASLMPPDSPRFKHLVYRLRTQPEPFERVQYGFVVQTIARLLSVGKSLDELRAMIIISRVMHNRNSNCRR